MDFVYYILIGVLAGTASGLLGVGGGMIVVPLLALTFTNIGMPNQFIMHVAAGTSLASMIITTASSSWSHNRRGGVRWDYFKCMVPGIIIGVVVGAIVAHFLTTEVLSIIFAIFLFAISIRMFFLVQPQSKTDKKPSSMITNIVSFLVGGKSGLLGVGGGAITVPFLVSCHLPMKQATGTSAICGFLIAIVGSITVALTGLHTTCPVPWTSGYVYWPAFFGVAIGSVIFAQVGAALSHRLPTNTLKRIFALFLLAIALNLVL